MDNFQEFIVKSKYCRWIEDKKRRETWDECVDRYYDYMGNKFNILWTPELKEAREATRNLEVFPSMRALMTAGPAADRDDTCLYNCAYLAINNINSFSDTMYILCCSTGVGFSCEMKEVTKLPEVPEEIHRKEAEVIVVPDSRRGWADSFKELLESLYAGVHPTWDTHLIRPAGSRLVTFGGRSSGPEPLEKLFRYTVNKFYAAKGRKLRPIEVHDIICMVGEIVIAGGVRRSALISLSDFSDREMSNAKSGPWWESAGHRSLSNNSAVYEYKPTLSEFLDEWSSLYNSKSGERGMCNRECLKTLANTAGRQTEGISFGTNPCSEIILRPKQFCNLTEVVIRANDTPDNLKRKVRIAAFLGTIQSACTNFTYLDNEWTKNCEEERLLGVSFTGIYDNRLMSGQLGMPKLRHTLWELREEAEHSNLIWAKALKISPSASITCCKPSGTTSCVAGTSSGMHPRYAQYYIRRARIDIMDPLCQFMMDSGVPHEADLTNPEKTMIFSFPIAAPPGCITQEELDPVTHLDLWLEYQKSWCDHKPSITVSYTDSSFLEVGHWVWKNWDWCSGISFLPQDDHTYNQAPFEKITANKYHSFDHDIVLDWKLLSDYEKEDKTTGSRELACSGGVCEVVDLVSEDG